MGETEQNKWDLMAKVLADEASSSEKDVLETWINLNDENKNMFEKSEMDWHAVEFQNQKGRLDIDAAWGKQLQRIQSGQRLNKEAKDIKKINNILKIAASILLVISLSLGAFFILNKFNNNILTVSTSTNAEPKTIVLHDGSEVTLNKNSTLSYPKKFNADKREVRLTGEAFFNISRNETKPFIIHTDKADVKVLGTSFNVNTTLKNLVEVYVYTGIVQLLDGKNPDNNLIIEKGQIGRLENQMLDKKVNSDKNYLAWKTKELFFKDTHLSDIARILSKVYNVNIEFEDPGIGKCLYTSTNSTFIKEELKDILNVICSTFNLEFERQNNTYLVKGEGC